MMIKHLHTLLLLLLSATVLLLLSACGGGGGGGSSPQPQKVTVTFALQGTPATIYSADLDVVLPDGFVLELETGSTDQPTDSALALLVADAELSDFSYIPATTGTNGEIIASIGKLAGFPGTANLMQISCTYPAGAALATLADFDSMVTVSASDDVSGTDLVGITWTAMITRQPAP